MGVFMQVLILDGHPDAGRLTGHLLDHYAKSLPASAQIVRIAIRDLSFNLNLEKGYGAAQDWEPDLTHLAAALDACDHLVVGFPLWWGAEPALLKAALDRILLPGFAFKYHQHDTFWDRLLAGRSADVLITMDTPPWYLDLAYGNPVGKRWTNQVLGFVGFAPVRVLRFGPTRRGGAQKGMSIWQAKIARAAASASDLKRKPKIGPAQRVDLAQALADRGS
jgi:putative NADPH-quinone reductase